MQTKTLVKQTTVVIVGVMISGYIMHALRDVSVMRDASRGYGG